MKKLILSTLFMALLGSGNVLAQSSTDSDAADATANVFTPITVTQVTDANLDFGNVFTGEDPAAITPDNGAQFDVSGSQQGVDVELTFTLPAELTGPGDPIGITFGGNSAAWTDGTTYNNPNTFDPNNSPGATVSPLPTDDGEVRVWIGGDLDPIPSAQTEGQYTATITLTADYAF